MCTVPLFDRPGKNKINSGTEILQAKDHSMTQNKFHMVENKFSFHKMLFYLNNTLDKTHLGSTCTIQSQALTFK
jgi:hypothetical protein